MNSLNTINILIYWTLKACCSEDCLWHPGPSLESDSVWGQSVLVRLGKYPLNNLQCQQAAWRRNTISCYSQYGNKILNILIKLFLILKKNSFCSKTNHWISECFIYLLNLVKKIFVFRGRIPALICALLQVISKQNAFVQEILKWKMKILARFLQKILIIQGHPLITMMIRILRSNLKF